MIAILLAFLLAAPVPCPLPHRNKGTVAKFHRLHPCPGGPDKGSTKRCRGYVVDHVCPLACCGVDGVQNMQWQSRAAAKGKRVEVPVLKGAELTRLEKAAERLDGMFNRFSDMQLAVHKTWSEIKEAMEDRGFRAPPPPPRPLPIRPAPPVRAPAPPRPRPEANGSAEGIGAGERRMLEALGRRHPQPLTRDQLGTLSGFAAGGGTFRNYVAHLKREGLVDESLGNVSLTPNGEKEVAHVIGTAQSPDEVRAMWKQSLGAGEWRMVEVLLDQGGEPITREKLGELSGFEASGGTFRNYASKIKRVGLALEEHTGIRVVEELLG